MLRIISILALFFAAACSRNKDYPPEPQIEYIAFEQIRDKSGKDSAGILRFRFRDGDGDIGLGQEDTFPPFNPGSKYYYNLFVDMLEKRNGTFSKAVFIPPAGNDTLTNNSRFPIPGSAGRKKYIEGEISVELFTNNPFSPWDTIKYEVSITDRALNRSNVITTPEIILKK